MDLHTDKTNPKNDSDNCFNYIDRIQSANPEDINQAIKKYFVRNNWYLALVGDVAENEVIINLS